MPTLLALWGAELTTSFFDWDLRVLLEQRSLTLKRSFEAIHNGPLQTLAVILRSLGEEGISPEQLRSQLQELNQELRSIPDSLSQPLSDRFSKIIVRFVNNYLLQKYFPLIID